jgi:hypothetical protein
MGGHDLRTGHATEVLRVAGERSILLRKAALPLSRDVAQAIYFY